MKIVKISGICGIPMAIGTAKSARTLSKLFYFSQLNSYDTAPYKYKIVPVDPGFYPGLAVEKLLFPGVVLTICCLYLSQ